MKQVKFVSHPTELALFLSTSITRETKPTAKKIMKELKLLESVGIYPYEKMKMQNASNNDIDTVIFNIQLFGKPLGGT